MNLCSRKIQSEQSGRRWSTGIRCLSPAAAITGLTFKDCGLTSYINYNRESTGVTHQCLVGEPRSTLNCIEVKCWPPKLNTVSVMPNVISESTWAWRIITPKGDTSWVNGSAKEPALRWVTGPPRDKTCGLPSRHSDRESAQSDRCW